MENSQNPKLPKEPSQPSDSVIDMPEEWKEHNFQDLFANRWKPRKKTVDNIQYITLRRGNNEKGLGSYTEERWQLMMSMLPKGGLPTSPLSASQTAKGGLLSGTIAKPEPLKAPIAISLEVMQWYQWAQNRGYNRNLGDFINETVHNWFEDQRLEYDVLIEIGEPEHGN